MAEATHSKCVQSRFESGEGDGRVKRSSSNRLPVFRGRFIRPSGLRGPDAIAGSRPLGLVVIFFAGSRPLGLVVIFFAGSRPLGLVVIFRRVSDESDGVLLALSRRRRAVAGEAVIRF